MVIIFNFGNLYIRSRGMTKVTDYVRYLDINDAVAGVKYTMDGVAYSRTYFASNPDSCVVVRYTASQKGKNQYNPYTEESERT